MSKVIGLPWAAKRLGRQSHRSNIQSRIFEHRRRCPLQLEGLPHGVMIHRSHSDICHTLEANSIEQYRTATYSYPISLLISHADCSFLVVRHVAIHNLAVWGYHNLWTRVLPAWGCPVSSTMFPNPAKISQVIFHNLHVPQ